MPSLVFELMGEASHSDWAAVKAAHKQVLQEAEQGFLDRDDQASFSDVRDAAVKQSARRPGTVRHLVSSKMSNPSAHFLSKKSRLAQECCKVRETADPNN